MLSAMRTPMRCRRPFCSTTSLYTLQSRPSSNSKPIDSLIIQRTPTPRNPKSPIYGFRAPSTDGIKPVDVAYSRFMNRHGPLEVANRLLEMGDPKPKRQEISTPSVIWRSATDSEFEVARIPNQAVKAMRSPSTESTNSALWSSEIDADEGSKENTMANFDAERQQDLDVSTTKVVLVPFGNRDLNAKDFCESLVTAVQDGLKVFDDYRMTSTKRKRRLKMNKHKFKKRRKEQESLRRKLGN